VAGGPSILLSACARRKREGEKKRRDGHAIDISPSEFLLAEKKGEGKEGYPCSAIVRSGSSCRGEREKPPAMRSSSALLRQRRRGGGREK